MQQQLVRGGLPRNSCPGTMGGKCKFVAGKCIRCERVEQKSQQEQPIPIPQIAEHTDQHAYGGLPKNSCPATMGGRCHFQDGKCISCHRPAPGSHSALAKEEEGSESSESDG